MIVDLKTALTMPDDRVVFMSTGSQGEPMAVLARMSNQDHQIEIGEGDTVILASSLIPGNENAVYRVINGLTKLGANVVHRGNAKVHTSGHASAGELLYCFNIIKPRNVLPVHGEARHLRAAADLAIETGVPAARTFIGDNGIVIDLKDGVAKVVGQIDIGFVYVDGSTVGEITDADLKDRRILAEEGFISVFIAIDAQTGKIIVGPEIQARGFAEDDSVFDGVRPQIVKALHRGRAERHARPARLPAGRAAHGRPLGQHAAPQASDDHPGRHRGVGVILEGDSISSNSRLESALRTSDPPKWLGCDPTAALVR